MIPFEQVQRGVAAYLDREIMPVFKDEGWKRVAAGAAIALAINRAGGFVPMLSQHQVIRTLGVMDEEGNVDVEALVPVLKDQLAKEPMDLNIPMLGTLTFRENDVDKLYEYIRTAR